jgi:hypothetical protein
VFAVGAPEERIRRVEFFARLPADDPGLLAPLEDLDGDELGPGSTIVTIASAGRVAIWRSLKSSS